MGKRERELFSYDDGRLIWLSPTSNRVWRGDTAGSLTTNGYYVVRYDKRNRMLHRVIWDYFNDTRCEGFLVDHRDGNGLNNRIGNLRLADYPHNAANSTRHSDSAVGLKGVHKHYDGRYRAQISVGGKRKHLGLFLTPEMAHKAYCDFASKVWGDFFHGGEDRKA